MPQSKADAIVQGWDRNEAATVLDALSPCMKSDLDYLASRLGDGARDQFWRSVIDRLRAVFQEG